MSTTGNVLGTLLGAGAGIGGGLLAKATGLGGPNNTQLSLANLGLGNAQQATNDSNALFPTGTGLLDLSKTNFAGPTNYWSSILKGGAPAFQAIAPQVNQANQANAAAGDALAKLAPRSGASTDIRAGSVYNPQKSITNLLQQQQPEAAKELSSIAGTEGSLGSYVSGQGLQGLTSAANSSTAQFLAQLQEQKNQQQQQQQLGSGIGSLVQQLLKSIPFFGAP